MSVAGKLVTVEGQAVIVAVRVVKIVEVVISGVGVPAGEELVGSTEVGVVSAVDSEDAGASGVEAEDSMALLEAGFAGPVIVVVKVIRPTVLLGETEETCDEDPDPSGLEWPDGETEEASGALVATGEPDGVLIETETLVEVDEPQLFSNEMLVTSTVAPDMAALGQSIKMNMSTSELTAVHCLEMVFQEPAVRVPVPTSAPLSRRFTAQVALSTPEPAVWRRSKETV